MASSKPPARFCLWQAVQMHLPAVPPAPQPQLRVQTLQHQPERAKANMLLLITVAARAPLHLMRMARGCLLKGKKVCQSSGRAGLTRHCSLGPPDLLHEQQREDRYALICTHQQYGNAQRVEEAKKKLKRPSTYPGSTCG